MLRVILSIMAVAVGVFAAEWTDFAAQPAEVSLGGKSYYEISSAKELAWFSKQVASGKTEINAVLKNDIVLWDSVSGDTNYWNPIGPSGSLAFEGIFDGAGKTISGAHSEYSQENVDSVFNGFFRFVGEKGVVKNFTLEKSVLQVEHLGSDTVYSFDEIANMPLFYPFVGNVVGENRGLVDSVRVIDCEAVAKGTYSTEIVNSGSTAASIMVNAYTMYLYVGGVVGLNRGSVTHAYVNGLIVPSHSTMLTMYMGGVVGANIGTVSESSVEGDLKDDYASAMAGICGLNKGTLDHVKMVGDMSTVTGYAAGIVAENRGLVEWAEYTGSLGRAGEGGVTIGGIAAYNLGKISKSFYGITEGTKTLKLSASLTDPSGMGISPAAYAGGIVAKQSNDGVVEDCGVRTSWIILGTNISNTVGMYTGGLVGADSGSVYNSYAAFSKISEVGKRAPLYNVILGGEHVGNHYDSVMMEKAFPGDTTGLEESLMESPQFAWMLNTKYQTVSNRNIWCHNGRFPVLALDGRKSTYGIVRYVNDIVLDTVYTDCSGLAVWGDSISDPNTGKKIGNWQLKNGDKTQNVGPQYVFSRDTSIYTSIENADWLLKEKSSSSSLEESSSSSAEPGSSSGTIAIREPLANVSLKYTVERGRIHLSGLTFAEPVSLFDVQGNLVKQEISTGSDLSIALGHRGMYILKYMGTSYRVFVP